ncbi:Mu-like prophage major head subunit gpT [Hydrogenophaga intermedia]|uniref:Mu-like prophage major head subunit gpT n=1 Tax=Hydrogenophaga intermedia TaxID=65786 RepID=A0A1L1PAG7_HYDIT|nr:Mu-like prophage major head subunit gpT family protein [Hydrogenophaga intermedia]CDN85774.1 Mu-like prophage major head subunit gpT [Hydrogenophaga intermedia]
MFATQSNIVGNPADGLTAVLICTRKPFKPFIVQPRRDFTLTAQFDPTNPTVFNKNKFEFGSDGRVGVGFGPWMLAVGIFGELTPAKYAEARAKMHGFTSDVGRKLGVTGDVLMVGTASEAAALEILSADRTTGGKTNIWRGTAQMMLYPYL